MKLKQLILKKGWLLVVPLFFSIMSLAQTTRFSEFYDSNNGAGLIESIVELNNGRLLGVGSNLNSANDNNSDGHHIVVSGEGQIVNDFAFTFPGATYNTQALLTSDAGGVYSAGFFCDNNQESPYCDFYISKLEENGDTVFTKLISRPDTNDYLLDMVQTTPNKILLIGWTDNGTPELLNANIFLITVDTLGNELNRVVYGGAGTDYIHSGIVMNENGDVLMAGYTASFNGSDNDSWVIKTDSIGNVQWQQVYNHLSSSEGDAIANIAQSSDGNYVLVGGATNPSTGEADCVIMKITPDGDEIWTKKHIASNGGSHSFWSGAVLDDGTILACGQTTSTSNGNQAGWLVKADENGDTLWTRVYNPSSNTDLLRNMLVLDNGDIVMVGFGRGENSTNQDGWILRVDSLGCLMEGCNTVGINEQLPMSNEQYLVYPNPATDVLNVEGLDPSTALRVTVVDFSGREILITPSPSLQGGELMQLDVSDWRSGIYLLSVRDENGNVVSKRVVKE